MTCYPIVIPTLCRYEHLKRCIDSLARNTHASETELIIGLDYPSKDSHWDGYLKICDYVKTISGFKKVTIRRRSENWGGAKNLHDLFEYAYESYDAAIETEDDNEFSPCFLDYMNKMLERYKNDARVAAVCGYSQMCYSGCSDNNILFSYDSNAWGSGYWRKQSYEHWAIPYDYYCNVLRSFTKSWKLLRTYPGCYEMLRSMVKNRLVWGDVMRTTVNIIQNQYCVYPSVSLSRNWGMDGSGEHCDTYDQQKFESQYISKDHVYSPDIIPVEILPATEKKLFLLCIQGNRFSKIKKLVKLLLLFLKDRFVKIK
jgi:hypothetical protein